MATLNLESNIDYLNLLFKIHIDLDFPIHKPPEKKQLKSRFMDEKGSDITFKIGDKTIPAHKEILTQKSKYFDGLFKSGMTESRQEIIEINDCEYLPFKGLHPFLYFFCIKNPIVEFLRYIYYEEAQLDESIAMKLLSYSDKYLQDDLSDKCMGFLTDNISSKNVYTILDFAHQENVPRLKNCCMKFLESNVTVNDLPELVKYINQEKNRVFIQENPILRDKAINFVIENYTKIFSKEKNFKLYADFLIDNFTIDTIGRIANWLYGPLFHGETRVNFHRDLANLKDALCDFAKENFQELKEKQITKKFPAAFWEELVSCFVEQMCKSEKKVVKISTRNSTEKAKQTLQEQEQENNKAPLLEKEVNKPSAPSQTSRKRKEAVNKVKQDGSEEKSELKKTKKTQPGKKKGK